MNKETFTNVLSALASGRIRFFSKPGKNVIREKLYFFSKEMFYETHEHSHPEMIFHLEGDINIFVNGNWETLDQDTLWVFTPGSVHAEKWKTPQKKYQLFWISILPQKVTFHITAFNPSSGYRASTRRLSTQTPFNSRLWDTGIMDNLTDNPLECHHFQSLLMEMLYYIIDNIERTNYLTENYHERIVEQVKLYIDNYYCQDISLGKIARMVHYSSGHLNVLFRKFVGISIYNYLLQKRLEYAKQVLTDDDVFIKDLAESIGFKDPLYFSRIFRKRFGVSPQKFVLQQKNK